MTAPTWRDVWRSYNMTQKKIAAIIDAALTAANGTRRDRLVREALDLLEGR